MIRRLRAYCDNREGALAVEAALILPFMITIGLGTVDGSYMLLQNHKMETQLALAGNYLAKSRRPGNLETQAKRLAVTGQVSAGGTALIPGWTSGDVTVSYKKVANNAVGGRASYRGGDTINIIRLQTTVPYEGFGLIKAVFGTNARLSASYEERVIGVYTS